MPTDPQAKATVLVVEDDRDIRELICFRLTRAGFAVHEAADGSEGLSAAASLEPDLVLLDWMMPGMDGLEVCRRLRDDPGTADIPVVILTARARDVDVERGLAAGADGYVAKPFTPAELLDAITSALASRRDGSQPSPG